jgi:uncharacterized membrane protein
MREWLVLITEYAIVFIDLIALVAIVGGTLQAAWGSLRLVSGAPGVVPREVWLRYARWLVAGLTFQLGADIIETSVTTDWEGIVRVAAIAVIRTFLNFFLERDLAEIREREHAAREVGAAAAAESR